MKTGICSFCSSQSGGLWLLNLTQIDSLKAIEGINLRQSVCQECAVKLNQVVKTLGNGNPTSMQKAFNKAGIKNQTDNPKNNEKGRVDLQNNFLSDLIKSKKLVQIESIEGIGWRGFVKSFDNFSLLITNEQSDAEELIFKHSVKSIKPI